MQRKVLASILCMSTLILTACGGGSDTSGTQWVGKENLDFSNSKHLKLIMDPILNLTHPFKNPIVHVHIDAAHIYEVIMDPENKGFTDISCETGSFNKNTDNSITLNKCKNFQYINSSGYYFQLFEPYTISGTIQSKNISRSEIMRKNELTLTNFTMESNEKIETYNGKITNTFTIVTNTQNYVNEFEFPKMSYKEIDKKNKDKNFSYILENYTLSSAHGFSSKLPTFHFSKGLLTGEPDGKKLSVTFNSQLQFNNTEDEIDIKPKSARIDIEDIANKQNSILIERASNDQAVIRVFANGKALSPRTVNWNELYD